MNEEKWINLTFHGVGEPPDSLTLSPGEEQCWISRESFYHHLDQAMEHEKVLITFDDGNLSDFEITLPALQDRGLSGIYFIVANRIGQPGYMGPEQIRALSNEGMEIGSHGMDHRPWHRMDTLTMEREINEAKKYIEEIVNEPVQKAACPFGAYGRKSLASLRKAGIQKVFTSDSGLARASDWIQARNSFRRSDPPDCVPRIAAQRNQPESWLLRAKRVVKRWR